MDELSHQVAMIIAEDELIIGNHESLSVFGASQQGELRECTRNIMSLMLNNRNDTDAVIEQTLEQIEKAEKQLQDEKRYRQSLFRKSNQASVIGIYNNILALTDQMTLTLQLQEVQLLKNEKIYEQLENQLRNCENQLSSKIEYGQKFLDGMGHVSEENKDTYEWKCRLERRVADMQVSLVVSGQSILQLSFLKDNSRKLIDKISAALNGTIPAWQTQITIALGLKTTHTISSVQEKLARISEQYEKAGARAINSEKQNIVSDANRSVLKQTDAKLTAILQDILIACKEDQSLRQEILNIISN